jgi:hypothetical protein
MLLDLADAEVRRPRLGAASLANSMYEASINHDNITIYPLVPGEILEGNFAMLEKFHSTVAQSVKT